jgi:hypothetical protein
MTTILAIQPEARQIGYAVFEGAALIDWGTKTLGVAGIPERVNRVALPLFRSLVDYHEPGVVVLPRPTKAGGTIRNQFLVEIRYELSNHGPSLASFSRNQIQGCFKAFLRSERPTKDRIMRLLVAWFPELRGALPRPRKPWESQDYWVPMFDAVTMAVTWLHYND